MWEPQEHIGHIANQNSVNDILNSIVDTTKDSYRWTGEELGIMLFINDHQIFVKNEDDLMSVATELYEKVKR